MFVEELWAGYIIWLMFAIPFAISLGICAIFEPDDYNEEDD